MVPDGMTNAEIGIGNTLKGYSLLEMLIALVILALLVVMFAQVINTISQMITKATNHMQCDAEAQLVFDRVGDDIAQIVNRSDVDSLFIGMPTNSSGTDHNDEMFFYSQGAGLATNATNQSQVSLISYRINNRRLERLGVTKSWDDLPYLTPSNSQTGFLAGNPLQNLGAATNYFHTLAPSVFRMEITLLMKVGTINPKGSPNGDYSINQVNSYANLTNSTNSWHGVTNVMAIVVALGMLDQTSRKIVTDQQLDSLSAILPDSSINGGTSIATWTGKALTTTNVSPATRSQIRIYQRSFPIKR